MDRCDYKSNALVSPKNGMALPGRSVSTEQINTDKGLILYLEGISVSFDGFWALSELNLYIEMGELRCIIGCLLYTSDAADE